MAARSLDTVLERLADRAREDDGLADTLRLLAEEEAAHGDPFAPPTEALLASARLVNARRTAARRASLAAGALTTGQVVELIGTISDRRAVDRRRRRGRLLGVKVGRTVLHPSWQFDRRRGDTHPGLPRVLAALLEVTDDAIAADALMTATQPALGERSIADVLADGDVELALSLIALAGDQS